jgi:hypothetical protein
VDKPLVISKIDMLDDELRAELKIFRCFIQGGSLYVYFLSSSNRANGVERQTWKNAERLNSKE